MNAFHTLATLRAIEARAEAAGVDLMARAARASADWLIAKGARRVLVAAGPGNNGGDALWAACLLDDAGVDVAVWLPMQPAGPTGRAALAALAERGVGVARGADMPRGACDWIVDGLFGIGLARPLAAPWDGVVAALNAHGAPILALDTPSGLDAMTGRATGPVVRAAATLTFLAPKVGLVSGAGVDLAGDVTLAALDVPSDWWPAPAGGLTAPRPGVLARPRDSHKGRFGAVCVVGGASGMLGAALLAGRAALAAGAGKVHVCPIDARLPVDPFAPELMIHELDDEARLPACDVLALGPGLGLGGAARALIDALIGVDKPLLLDADALNLVAADAGLGQRLAARVLPTVLTPHPREAARLLACDTAAVQADRVAAAQTLAERYRAVVVLKGAGSVIAAPGAPFLVNGTGGPALAVAGQGDVLSGAIAALLAQGLAARDAAALAVHAHGTAGDDYARDAGGPLGLTSAALLPRLSRMLNRYA
ncbi:bifunctional ADP-dependent NAD(P)H-hydrate dehydratase/NAD(P)H-hydrate epimerase [Crenobacter luteus]|uniref:Bifunctional NAD(P)H-hydrate repair enzyme n=1 Tax=Crenobacter luteus TaxID=1452487 RepID=A0A163CF00_9NEIS|nr:bifunctional ADP-dependent NAD(P)H-hydrate dehydratase/NAD(P)H-hydrate epimerase [Crenobacter luteus]KZE31707.1 bifunctional ADP-dependent (S)-NAD(P)H-hydrate dehydratase/NAD(P)H-hydrate epimerase [Crenobacter luteus]